MPEKVFSAARLWRSFGFAFKGISASFAKEQRNIQIHAIIAMVVVVAGFLFKIDRIEWIIIILCIGLVISTEMINTAIEKLTDISAPEWNEKAGTVKDIAAGSVLVVTIASVIVGCLIFIPKILALF